MSEANKEDVDYSQLRSEPKWRKRRRKKWRDVLVVAIILAVAVTAVLFVYSPYCAVGTIQLKGNKLVSLEEISREGQIGAPVNIIRLQPAAIQALLKKDLRIATVEVDRKWWPPALSIVISENAVMAYIFSDYGTLSLDKNGMVLAAQKTFSNYDAPLIAGIKLTDEYVGESAHSKEVIQCVEFLAKLDSSTFDLISEVKLQNSQEVYLLLTDGIQVRLGDFSRPEVKSKYIKQMIKEIAEKNFAISMIDLKFEPPTMRVKQ